MTAPILQEKFDASGKLIEIVWSTPAVNSSEMLAALKAAMRRMEGPLVFSASAVPNKAYPITEGGRQSLFQLITEGASRKRLTYNGKLINLSNQRAIILGTLLESQGRIFTTEELVEVLYPNPDMQPLRAKENVWTTIYELRKMFPDLIDSKRYVIRG